MSQAGFRLSPEQRAAWAAAEQGRALPWVARVEFAGELEPQACRRALSALGSRLEILRTGFDFAPGLTVPLQWVKEEARPKLAWLDLTALAAGDRDRAASEVAREAAAAGRPWQQGGVELLVAKAGPAAGWLLWKSSPLVAGPQSLWLLASAWAEEVAGSPGADTLQYADLAEWQNSLLEGEETAQERLYWRSWAGSSRPEGTWASPPEGERPPQPAVARRRLPGEVIHSLAAAGNLEGELAACWWLQAAAWQAEGEPALGLLANGRSYEDLERAVGPLARHLPLRLPAPQAAEGFRGWAGRVGQALAADREWQEYCPLFPERVPYLTAFEHRAVGERWARGGLALRLLGFERVAGAPGVALTLAVESSPEGVEARLAFDRARLAQREAEALLERWAELVARVAAQPAATVASFERLSRADQAWLDTGWNGEQGLLPDFDTVLEPILREARRASERVALVGGEEHWSWGYLESYSAGLAGRLRALGAGPDRLVALSLPRSAGWLGAMLGIWRSGAGCLPLDPALPAARRAQILALARPAVILAEPELVRDLDLAGLPRLHPSSAGEAAGAEALELPLPASLAYVLFTSGSTGQPRGVMVEHRQLAAYTGAVARRLGLATAPRAATASTLHADLGHTAIFPVLAAGGTLQVVPLERLADPEGLAAELGGRPPDLLKIVPGHLAALLGRGGREILPRRWLVLGGEALPPALVAEVRQLAPELAVFNHYGPTETTVGVLCGQVADEPASTSVPLGRPLAGSAIHLVARDGQRLPPGLAGEIWIGGAGVARGYLDRPAATADRYRPDPWAGKPGARLYRSGDRALLRPEGALVFLGRLDDQVKIRGHRVEPSEIAAVLAQHPAVAQAAVLASGEEGGALRLAAYVVPAAGERPSALALRGFLAERLPEPMVPAAFRLLAALPRTANGKLDRRALLALPAEPAEAPPGFAEPKTELEKRVAQVWREALRVERVGLHDNFFDLGGNSLLLVEVGTRLQQELATQLPMLELFRNPTLATLTSYLAAGGAAREELRPGHA
ncbi:MAG: amino acid adenylation domain-containing protein [Thermoanaerobaculia bacterium]